MKFYRSIVLLLHPMCVLTTIALAQRRVVSGIAKDPAGDAFTGVTIQVMDTAAVLVSGSGCNYTITQM